MFKLKDYFTAGSLLVSITAVIFAFHGRIPLASFLVFVAWGFDTLDGLVARLTKSGNAFGAQFDDLVDHVAYTISPGFIAFAALSREQWWAGLLACFATMLFGTIRLARGNTFSLRFPGYWIGMPRTISGFMIVLILNARFLQHPGWVWVQVALIVVLALAGLSSLPYRNHKTRLRWWEFAFPITAVLTSLACYPLGLMWEVGTLWTLVYLGAPWISATAAQRDEVARMARAAQAS